MSREDLGRSLRIFFLTKKHSAAPEVPATHCFARKTPNFSLGAHQTYKNSVLRWIPHSLLRSEVLGRERSRTLSVRKNYKRFSHTLEKLTLATVTQKP